MNEIINSDLFETENMLFLLSIVGSVAYFSNIVSATGNCLLREVSEENWNSYFKNQIIIDEHHGIIKPIVSKNVLNVTIKPNEYLDAWMSDGVVVFTATDKFRMKFEEETPSDRNESYFDVVVDFQCTSGNSQLVFRQPVQDINNHQPKFNSPLYKYQLEFPVKSGYELTKIVPIYATDIDIDNDRIKFSIEKNEFFEITYGGVQEDSLGKTHVAVLKAKKDIEEPIERVFTIYATDVGSQPLSTTAVIIISPRV